MTPAWQKQNQAGLAAALNRIHAVLRRDSGEASLPKTGDAPALETVCALFHLSPFERDVLLLCAGMELDSRFAEACAGQPPTFALALASLPEPHWSALAPSGPLRPYFADAR